MSKSYFKALTIAGSDCSGGAGIQADLKTFSALGVYGMSVITAVTAQNTTKVTAVHGIPEEIVGGQIDAIFEDIIPNAVKIGMLFNAGIVNTVADYLIKYSPTNIVLDPVMISTSGHRLIDEQAIQALIKRLIPLCDIITPNKFEAEYLSEMNISSTTNLIEAGREILSLGAKSVLIKGGHFDDTDMTDYLFTSVDSSPIQFKSQMVTTPNTHGTGCTLSSAIAANLAIGKDMAEAVSEAKKYLTEALIQGAEINIGSGHGPVNHLFNPKKLYTTQQ